jgi:NAD-dependent DNA ligase
MSYVNQLVDEAVALNAFRATDKMRRAAETVLSIWMAGDHVEPSDGEKINFLAKKFPFKGRAYTWSAKAGKWLGWTRRPKKHSVAVGTVEGLDVAALAQWAKQVDLYRGSPWRADNMRDLNRLIVDGDVASTKPGANVKLLERANKKPIKPLVKKPKSVSGKTFLFTGKLASGHTREQAGKLVKKSGGKVVNHVSKELDYLVVGDAGSPLFKGDNKRARVERLQKEGAKTRILSEPQFFKVLDIKF